MATDFHRLRAMFDELELKYFADGEREWFYLPYRHWAITAHLAEDGVMFRVPYLGRRDDMKKPKRSMRRLLAENSRLKVAQYVIAPDGEIQASYFLLWLDEEPATEEVRRVLSSLCGLAERYRAVLAGEAPPWVDADSHDTDVDQSPEDAAEADPDGAREMIDRVFDELLDEMGDDSPFGDGPDPD